VDHKFLCHAIVLANYLFSADRQTLRSNQVQIDTDTMATKPLTKFKLFGKLPRETQLEIFKYACNESRIVEVRTDLNSGDSILAPTSLPPPALLHACRLSRLAAQEVYGHLKEIDTGYDAVESYFNENTDILYLADFLANDFIQKFTADALLGRTPLPAGFDPDEQVRKLAIPLQHCMDKKGRISSYLFPVLQLKYPNLEHVTFIINRVKVHLINAPKEIAVPVDPVDEPEVSRAVRMQFAVFQIQEIVRRDKVAREMGEEVYLNPFLIQFIGWGVGLTDQQAAMNKFPDITIGRLVHHADWRSKNKKLRQMVVDGRNDGTFWKGHTVWDGDV
jgi:hypothetical protein